jgi:hypothetical protein
MRPVFRGMCKLESLLDGTLTLEDLAMANDYIDVHIENEHRMIEAMREPD